MLPQAAGVFVCDLKGGSSPQTTPDAKQAGRRSERRNREEKKESVVESVTQLFRFSPLTRTPALSFLRLSLPAAAIRLFPSFGKEVDASDHTPLSSLLGGSKASRLRLEPRKRLLETTKETKGRDSKRLFS